MGKEGYLIISLFILVLSASFSSAFWPFDYFKKSAINGNAPSGQQVILTPEIPESGLIPEGTIYENSNGCTDSDNGVFAYKPGDVSFVTRSWFGLFSRKNERQDECLSDSILLEYYCRDGKAIAQNMQCEGGCENGECKLTNSLNNIIQGQNIEGYDKICSPLGEDLSEFDAGLAELFYYKPENYSDNFTINYTSYCLLNNITLIKYGCNLTKELINESVICENGCYNGACNVSIREGNYSEEELEELDNMDYSYWDVITIKNEEDGTILNKNYGELKALKNEVKEQIKSEAPLTDKYSQKSLSEMLKEFDPSPGEDISRELTENEKSVTAEASGMIPPEYVSYQAEGEIARPVSFEEAMAIILQGRESNGPAYAQYERENLQKRLEKIAISNKGNRILTLDSAISNNLEELGRVRTDIKLSLIGIKGLVAQSQEFEDAVYKGLIKRTAFKAGASFLAFLPATSLATAPTRYIAAVRSASEASGRIESLSIFDGFINPSSINPESLIQIMGREMFDQLLTEKDIIPGKHFFEIPAPGIKSSGPKVVSIRGIIGESAINVRDSAEVYQLELRSNAEKMQKTILSRAPFQLVSIAAGFGISWEARSELLTYANSNLPYSANNPYEVQIQMAEDHLKQLVEYKRNLQQLIAKQIAARDSYLKALKGSREAICSKNPEDNSIWQCMGA